MSGLNLKKTFLYSLIASTAISALIGIGVLLFGDFGDFEIRVMLTTLTIMVASILGLACGAYYEASDKRTLPLTGIVLAVVTALMTFLIIWDVANGSETNIKLTVTVSLLALSASHLSLLSLARLDRRFAWSRTAAFILVGALDAILLFLLWFEPDGKSEIVPRVIGVLSILIASATVMTPVFHKLSRVETVEKKVDEIDAEITRLKEQIDELEAQRRSIVTAGDAPTSPDRD